MLVQLQSHGKNIDITENLMGQTYTCNWFGAHLIPVSKQVTFYQVKKKPQLSNFIKYF